MEIGQWLRCNSCFSKQETNNSPFSLTSCGHIFCKLCVSTGNKCLYCKTMNISSMLLTDSVSSQVKYIFNPLEDSFEKLRLAFVFQKTQSRITHQRLGDLEKLSQQMSIEYLQIYNENQVLKAELKHSKENLDKYKQCFIAKAIPKTSSTSANSANVESNKIQRHMVFYTPSNLAVQAQPNNEMISLTPPDQRLRSVRKTPGIIKKSKEKKRISQVDDGKS